MWCIKNSIKNIYRYRSKYSAFGILYLVIILVFSVCVSVFIQMRKINDNVAEEYASIAEFDTNVHISDGQKRLRFTKDDFLKFKEKNYIDEIKFFKYIFDPNYLRENVSEIKKELHISGEIIQWEASPQPFNIHGYNMSLLYLETDEFALEKGRMFEKDDEVVIEKNRKNQDYPEWNDLDLDDKIILKNDNGIYKEFTIVGIKEQNPKDTDKIYRFMIYTTLESAEYFDVIASETKTSYISYGTDNLDVLNEKDFINLGYETLIYLDSLDNFILLKNELYNEGVRIKLFFTAATALINLTNTTQIWSVIFMAFSGFVILCMTIISTNILLNTRKYEIAVLRSVGMKKSRIILNFLIENMVFIWGITFIALIATQFISIIFTNRVFEDMRAFISDESFETLTRGGNFALILQNIGFVFGGTTVVVVLSLIFTCVNIVRFEPLKIFNKQY